MNDSIETVLDYKEGIKVFGNPFTEPANEYWALVCLWHGMDYIYHHVASCEAVVRERVNPGGNNRVHLLGNGPWLNGMPIPLLTCSFHWYAVSACNYARTIGAIAHRQDNAFPKPPHYVAKVIPDVLAFRDKVAAHFAWATGNKKDNDAERLASVLPPLTFNGDALQVGGLCISVRRGMRVSDSKAIKPWSLTKVHENLRERYWPTEQEDSQ